MPDKKKVSLGNPLSLTDKELDALTTAEETAKIEKLAAEFWRENADNLIELLDAELTEEGA